MTRPLGPLKVSSALALPDMVQPLRVHRAVVKQAEQGQIVEVGAATGFPRDDVVDIGEGHVGAAREATLSVPAHDLSALGIAREPLARPSYMVCPTSSSRATTMVASQAIRCTVSASIRPPCSSSPARALSSPASSTRAARGRGRPRHRGWSWWPWSVRPCRAWDRGAGSIPTRASQRRWSKGVSPVGWDLLEPRIDAGLGLGVGIGRQLGADGAVGVVEAQEATIVLGARTRTEKRSGPARLLSGRCRPAHGPSTPWPGRTARGRSRGWPRRPAPAPCRRRSRPGTSDADEVREIPGLLGDMGVGPSASASRPRSARRSTTRERSPRRRETPGAARTRPGGR